MSNFVKCNVCAFSRSCTKKGDNLDSKNCTSFIKLDNFVEPMLLHLLQSSNEKTVNDAVTLLESFDIKIKEKDEHPYFSLYIR